MKIHLIYRLFLMTLVTIIFCSCGIKNSVVSNKSTAYFWKNNVIEGIEDTLYQYKPRRDAKIKAKIIEKTDYIVIIPDKGIKSTYVQIDHPKPKVIKLPAGFRTDESGQLYFPEVNYDPTGKNKKLTYYTVKTGLQALAIPFKFRGEIKAQNTISRIAPQVETGLGLGFAFGIKQNLNIYSPSKNFWGKNLTTFSVTVGPMFGGTTADLNAATNAPGLDGNRKSVALSYGGFIMFGAGPINFGYAVGADRVLGQGASNWVYQGNMWHGVIVALNVLTF